MASPPHPQDHDARVREILDSALEGEILIPCPDKATAVALRAKFYYLIRAHRVWKTGRERDFGDITTKIISTSRACSVRPIYAPDIEKYPWTFRIDGRSRTETLLENAVHTNAAVPMTGSPSPITSAMGDWPDDDDDDDNTYARISQRFRPQQDT